MNNKVDIQRLDKNATLPTRNFKFDAGLDLYASENVSYNPGQIIHVPLKIAVDILPGYVGLIYDRSSMSKAGFKSLGGVIDAGYTGEVSVMLLNLSGQHGCILKGQKVAQLLIMPVELPQVKEVDSLGKTDRGSKGFGSSGF